MRFRASALLGVAVQGLSSASNLVLVTMVGRATTVDGFGRFALAYTAFGLVLGLIRASVLDRLLVAGTALGAAVVTAALAGAFTTMVTSVAAVALAWSSAIDLTPVLALAVTAPVVFVNDAGRYLALAAGRADQALRSDVVWLAVALLAFTVPAMVDGVSLPMRIGLWGAGALAGAAVNGELVAAWHRRPPGLRPLPPDRALSADFALMTSRGFVLLAAVTAVHGPVAAAVITVAQVAFQPLASVLQGLRFVYLRLLARRSEVGIAGWALALLGLGLGWALTLSVLPEAIGTAVFGASFTAALPVLWVLSLFEVMRLVEVPATDVFRAGGRHRELVTVRAMSAGLLFALSAVVVSGRAGSLVTVLQVRFLVAALTVIAAFALQGLWWPVASLDRGSPASAR